MKLQDNIKYVPVSFEAAGATWYMKALTIKEVQDLQERFKGLEENAEDLSPLMYLFTDVLVDEEGNRFEDIEEGMTFDQLAAILPIQAIHEIAAGITDKLSNSGN